MDEIHQVSGSPRRILLFAQPRTTSYLLTQMLGLSNQPSVHWKSSEVSVFAPTAELLIGLEDKPVEQWTAAEKGRIRGGFQQAFDALDRYLRDGEAKGKIVFAKDHCNLMWNPAAGDGGRSTAPGDPYFTVGPPDEVVNEKQTIQNPTVLPDGYLGSWVPVFLIRHPALVFPSFCRGALEVAVQRNSCRDRMKIGKHLREQMTFSYTRCLYDWYTSYFRKIDEEGRANTKGPILLDSFDLINDSRLVVVLAEELGLDRSKVQFSWDSDSYPCADRMKRVFRRTLNASTGVIKDRAIVDSNMVVLEQKWKEEFGDELGDVISDCVRDAMPDYEYLRDKRLRVA
ncbi:hypothetical protein P168DRAFT_240372 [Aspergillus campestris IBT 28561]|uniref:P-loop containing nucleoside triphosphate hydrolase protein n=1 Tax=Aspergillus campestris (strain IBT 28561) TaxID=1392248 RepID=A0A2I1CXK5_ASPC2|nr:uncharacterized protein P168DRAFT_240372 [Aspergillus campestris IBT 28561]PKY02348.1 hypothetical protein P168DRAFT_240372 [Aspergillus campestris IBT 28561]